MRINKFVALATGMSRRRADECITNGDVLINNTPAQAGQRVGAGDTVSLYGKPLSTPQQLTTIMLHKPVGYVSSRNGQGSKTIYDLLPARLHNLKAIGRLDKDSSGLLLLTNDGALSQYLLHPRNQKIKIYEVSIDKPLTRLDWSFIHEQGVMLPDGTSKLFLERIEPFNDKNWRISMREGRNRQIRRTFAALGYQVITLHRTHFGNYSLQNLPKGEWRVSPN